MPSNNLGEKMSENCTCDQEYVTIEEVRDEIAKFLKKIIKTEFCPSCKELQNMTIIYHIDDSMKGIMPKITENIRCPGCLKLFENKLEEVIPYKGKKDEMGFGIGDIQAKALAKKIEDKNNKIKQEETKEN